MKQLKDSMGVPQEPEDNPLLFDWQDQPLYEGEEAYETCHGFVREEDILEYFTATHEKIWIGE